MSDCARSPASDLSAMLSRRVDDLVPALLSGARRTGNYWQAADTSGNVGKSLYVHRAGPRAGDWRDAATDEHGDLIDLVAAVRRVSLRDAMEWARSYLGIDPACAVSKATRTVAPPVPKREELDKDARERQAAALKIWHECKPAAGTLVESYLRSRGIAAPVPPSIRFHPSLSYGLGAATFPAMVAAVQDSERQVCAVHRTYLRVDGLGKAGIDTPKKALGPLGSGAVRLGPASQVLGLSEGVETGLAAQQIHGISVWSALGCRLDQIALPFETAHVVIFRDNGEAGERAADRVVAAQQGQGRRVTIKSPPAGVDDWNDVLASKDI
jgi:hypothetical protein